MPDEIKRLCPICRDVEMKPYRSGYLFTRETLMSLTESYTEVAMYLCPQCRYVAIFAPVTPLEEFEQQQVLQEALSPVEKFEHTFQNYSDKQLQKVIDGKDYVPDAKKAARNLLYRRKYGE